MAVTVQESSAYKEVRQLRRTDSDGAIGAADVTYCGRLFQIRATATGKARSPIVDNRVRRTINDDGEAERRRRRASRYAGWLKVRRQGTTVRAAPC